MNSAVLLLSAGLVASFPVLFLVSLYFLIFTIPIMRRGRLGEQAILLGAVIYLSYPAWSCVIIFFDQLSINIMTNHGNYLFLSTVLAIASLIRISLVSCNFNYSYKLASRGTKVFFLLTLLSVAAVATLYAQLASLSVAQGWDFFDLWGPSAIAIIQHFASESYLQTNFEMPYIHPATISYILAWGAWSGSHLDNHSFIFSDWFWLFSASALMIFGLAFTVFENKLVALLLACAGTLLGPPLIVNSYLLPGYADIWVAVGVQAMVFIEISRRVSESRALRLAFGALTIPVVVSLAFFKDTSWIYPILFYTSVLLVSRVKCIFVAMLGIISLGVFFYVANYEALEISPFGFRVGILQGGSVVWLGDRYAYIAQNSLSEIMVNFFQAFIINSSFGVTASLFLIVFVGFLSILRNVSQINRFTNSAAAVSLFIILIFAFFVIGQFISDYLFSLSVPDHDTGLSRFIMVLWFPICALAIMLGREGLLVQTSSVLECVRR